jgi:hypothetical protein
MSDGVQDPFTTPLEDPGIEEPAAENDPVGFLTPDESAVPAGEESSFSQPAGEPFPVPEVPSAGTPLSPQAVSSETKKTSSGGFFGRLKGIFQPASRTQPGPAPVKSAPASPTTGALPVQPGSPRPAAPGAVSSDEEDLSDRFDMVHSDTPVVFDRPEYASSTNEETAKTPEGAQTEPEASPFTVYSGRQDPDSSEGPLMGGIGQEEQPGLAENENEPSIPDTSFPVYDPRPAGGRWFTDTGPLIPAETIQPVDPFPAEAPLIPEEPIEDDDLLANRLSQNATFTEPPANAWPGRSSVRPEDSQETPAPAAKPEDDRISRAVFQTPPAGEGAGDDDWLIQDRMGFFDSTPDGSRAGGPTEEISDIMGTGAPGQTDSRGTFVFDGPEADLFGSLDALRDENAQETEEASAFLDDQLQDQAPAAESPNKNAFELDNAAEKSRSLFIDDSDSEDLFIMDRLSQATEAGESTQVAPPPRRAEPTEHPEQDRPAGRRPGRGQGVFPGPETEFTSSEKEVFPSEDADPAFQVEQSDPWDRRGESVQSPWTVPTFTRESFDRQDEKVPEPRQTTVTRTVPAKPSPVKKTEPSPAVRAKPKPGETEIKPSKINLKPFAEEVSERLKAINTKKVLAVTGIVLLVAGFLLAMVVGVIYLLRMTPRPATPQQANLINMVPTVDMADRIYPTGIKLTGGWFIYLQKGELKEGQWNPQSSEWLAGTEVRRLIAIPWTKQSEAVIRSMQPGDPIELFMSNNDILEYKVDSVEKLPRNQTDVMTGKTPSLAVILYQQDAPDRWVVVCKK